MTSDLRGLLRPIHQAAVDRELSSAGRFASIPDNLVSQLMKFLPKMRNWMLYAQKTEKNNAPELFAINSQCVDVFLADLVTLCLKYRNPSCYMILAMIPWHTLSPEQRQSSLGRILAEKDVRLDLWRQALKLLNETDAKRLASELTLGRDFLTELLAYDNVQTEFFTLPVARILLFFKLLPQLIFKIPVYDLWFFARNGMTASLALAIFKPFAQDDQVEHSLRCKANFAAAEIHMARRELALAKPYLDRLEAAGDALTADEHMAVVSYQARCHSSQLPYRGAEKHASYWDDTAKEIFNHPALGAADADVSSLTHLLSELKSNLNKYLGKRNTGGLVYSLGIYNAQLSAKKNALVSELLKDINVYSEKLARGELIDPGVLVERLQSAEALNKRHYQQYKRVFDGAGTLTHTLRTACYQLATHLYHDDERLAPAMSG